MDHERLATQVRERLRRELEEVHPSPQLWAAIWRRRRRVWWRRGGLIGAGVVVVLVAAVSLPRVLPGRPSVGSAQAPAVPPGPRQPIIKLPPQGPEPPDSGGRRTGLIGILASGVVQGDVWQLTLYRSTEGFCWGIRYGRGWGHQCGGRLVGPSGIGVELATSARPYGAGYVSFVSGQVGRKVARVRIELPGRPPLLLRPIRTPAQLPANLHVAVLPSSSLRPSQQARVLALATDGSVLDRRQLALPALPGTGKGPGKSD
jgi:hypothetical protein